MNIKPATKMELAAVAPHARPASDAAFSLSTYAWRGLVTRCPEVAARSGEAGMSQQRMQLDPRSERPTAHALHDARWSALRTPLDTPRTPSRQMYFPSGKCSHTLRIVRHDGQVTSHFSRNAHNTKCPRCFAVHVAGLLGM